MLRVQTVLYNHIKKGLNSCGDRRFTQGTQGQPQTPPPPPLTVAVTRVLRRRNKRPGGSTCVLLVQECSIHSYKKHTLLDLASLVLPSVRLTNASPPRSGGYAGPLGCCSRLHWCATCVLRVHDCSLYSYKRRYLIAVVIGASVMAPKGQRGLKPL